MKNFRVKSISNKTTTFSIITGKSGKSGKQKNVVANVTIEGVIPRPNPSRQRPVMSFISETEHKALLEDRGFKSFVEDGVYIIKEVPFKVLPDAKQREYDKDLYIKLQLQKRKEKEDENGGKKDEGGGVINGL